MSHVTDTPAAASADALAHFRARLTLRPIAGMFMPA